MKKLSVFIVFFALLALQLANAQTRLIKGTVTSKDDGMGIPGVSVVVEGQTSIGVTTDLDGNYQLNVPQGAKNLLFSFVGMKQVSLPISGAVINAVMESDKVELDEVVVVGYGTTKRSTFTGAATNVKAEKITAVPVTSVEKALQGAAPGLLSKSNSGQPGSASTVIVRGIGSITAGTTPLYIVDGIPVITGDFSQNSTSTDNSSLHNALANISSSDIESVTVLKDASATSIYGARAANGVVLITTKSGKQGKSVIKFSQQTGFSSRANKNFKVLNTAQYMELSIEAWKNQGRDDAYINGQIASLYPVKDATVTDVRDPKRYYDTDWVKQAYKDNAPAQQWEISASGGNEKTNFYTSLSYFAQDGIVIGSNMERYSGRLNVNHKASDKLSLGMSSMFSVTDQGTPLTTSAYYSSPIAGSVFTPPTNPAKNADGTWYDAIVGNNGVNFAAVYDYNDVNSRANRSISSFYAQYEFIPGLRFKTATGLDFLNFNELDYDDPRSRGNTAFGIGRATGGSANALNWTNTNTLTYEKSFNEVHNFDIMLGEEATAYTYSSLQASSENFASFNLRQIDSGAKPVTASGSSSEYKFLSYFARANYNYQGKYYLTGSFRRDGSSRFGEDNKYANFYSVGTSWRISEEAFIKDNYAFINNLQLRASYGTTGNSSIGYYASLGLYSFDIAYGTNPGSRPSQIANPDLKWERSKNANIGLDFKVFGRVTGTIEVYHKTTSDLLLNTPLSSTTGFLTTLKNIGEMVNKGIELQLNADLVKVGDFTWAVEGNATVNRNEVTKLYQGLPIGDGFLTIEEGKSLKTFYLKQWAGVNPADGRPMWYDANGAITFDYSLAARDYSGTALPKVYGGLGTSVSYKGLSLSASFFYQYGNKIYENPFRILQGDGAFANFNQMEAAMDRWQQPGDITDVPIRIHQNSQGGNNASTRWLRDGSFIRLKNVTLSYDLPKSIVSKAKLGSVRLFAQGQNLWTTKYEGMDPEQDNDGDTWFQYPNAKTYTFGLDLTF